MAGSKNQETTEGSGGNNQRSGNVEAGGEQETPEESGGNVEAGGENQETPEGSGGNVEAGGENQETPDGSGGNVEAGGENQESAAVRRQHEVPEDWDYSVRGEEWVVFYHNMKALEENELNLGRFGGGGWWDWVQPQWRGGGMWVQPPWHGGGWQSPPPWRGGGPGSIGRGWHHRPPLE